MPGIHQKIELTNTRKRPAPGLQEGQALSKKLLQLWPLGKLSSSGLQEIASAAVADGLQNEDIVELSGLGTFGQYPSNCHRDILRLLKAKSKRSMHGGLQESPTMSIQVPALDAKEEKPETMAPHCIAAFAGLAIIQQLSKGGSLAFWPSQAESFLGKLEKQ